MKNFSGVITAIVTPFQDGGGIDGEAFRTLIQLQVDAGVHGLVIGGSTGEGQTMTGEERREALKIALEFRSSSFQIIGSCGSPGTDQTIADLKELKDLGVDGALVSSPSYNKPPQRGLIEHFQNVCASEPDLPIILYNIPGRAAINIETESLLELWKIPNAVAVKEASGNWNQVQRVIQEAPEGKHILSGEDPLTAKFLEAGAHGSISVLSNVAPKACVELWKASQEKNWDLVNQINQKLKPLVEALFTESNPIPAKFACSALINKKLPPRLPLVELAEAHQATLRSLVSELKS